MDHTADESWKDIYLFYRDLIDKYNNQGPMLSFVSWLASGKYAKVLFPCTSIHALGLSAVSSYDKRCRYKMVFINYIDNTSRFAIDWQLGQGKTVRTEVVDSPTEPVVFSRILEWLDISER